MALYHRRVNMTNMVAEGVSTADCRIVCVLQQELMHPRQLLHLQAPLVDHLEAIQTVRVSLAVLVVPLVAQAEDRILVTGEVNLLYQMDSTVKPCWRGCPCRGSFISIPFPIFGYRPTG